MMIQAGAKTQAFKGLEKKKLCKVKRATTQGDYGLHRVKKVDPTGQVFRPLPLAVIQFIGAAL